MTLTALIADKLGQPVPPEIRAMAMHVAADRSGVAAVIAYGSCLRGVATAESLIDLYVLTDDLRGVSANALSRLACALAPPNVYYAECDFEGQRYRAKYAVLPLALFARWMTTDNPYFWARFSQPCALLYAANEAVRQQTVAAIVQAATTMFGASKALAAADDPLQVWTAGFAQTYLTELRPEAASRGLSIVAAHEDYYRTAAGLLKDCPPRPANWKRRQSTGKLWSVVRLVKAAFTFTGGADYMVWKIERHSGHHIELSDWQRRHPVITGLMLLPQLLKRGAVR
jgi:hypothetical protein